ncbi:MAG: T9SS type A sorting domain-containing protein [Bacteroidia bacterium]|nr:T9SS type A sorting domain-containing protein [Bacteroidia bacterium]
MKTKFTLFLSFLAISSIGQTITYTNFSNALTDTLQVNIADNSSFNTGLLSINGTGVTWNASALTVASGIPTIHLSYGAPLSTPNGTLYPNSNFASGDPALSTVVGVEYYNFSADSVVMWGSYESNTSHEIFQNPDRRLIFPFAYGQSFTDTYSKTNYSNATTVSSYQTGSRTVSFNGYGTLILPQGTVSNVALISEVRTNSLGPNSTEYTWYNISNGKKLLMRSENNGNIITGWCSEILTSVEEIYKNSNVSFFPNPMNQSAQIFIEPLLKLSNPTLKIYNVVGKELKEIPVKDNKAILYKEDLSSGIYFYSLYDSNTIISTNKFIIQ